ncbi:hypothetical protein Tcan_18973 [Toxocara canis]|uniref:Uncharacterized protein n=1 Tax=Toxocara canis TaxID=6265 RepID=A0A0B2VAI4_TOXCA|nr:hypothetical protein Tcan_18973 [Toxocara canis]
MRPTPCAVPEEFVDARYHRRCGIHVQTLLLAHCLITIIISLLAIGFGVVLIYYPNLHQKSPVYKQLFQHYSRTKTNSYYYYYRIAIFSWIAIHSLHMITVAITVLGTQVKTVLVCHA